MEISTTARTIDLTRNFEGGVLEPVPVAAAVRRILAYCTEPRSGWATYDLAGAGARKSGMFESVTAWSLFYANALNGRVALDDVAAFDRSRRREFADRLARIPEGTDLHNMSTADVDAVVDACHFGFPGVWGPKITKLGALYRPKGIPVLDGHVAEAFGFNREGFSTSARQRSMTRRERIDKVVRALASAAARHRSEIAELRLQVSPVVPEFDGLPDLRLMDMVLWTAQDDRMQRRSRQRSYWIDRPIGPRLSGEDLLPEPIRP